MTDTDSRVTRGRQRYHHGDLRRDLLRVARDEIARHGAQAVSLTSLARRAGVSQPAPYRHFADREALLEAVAAEAFEEFADRLGEAMKDRTPMDALKAIALAYVTFGEANIEIHRLMVITGIRIDQTTSANPASPARAAIGCTLLRSPDRSALRYTTSTSYAVPDATALPKTAPAIAPNCFARPRPPPHLT